MTQPKAVHWLSEQTGVGELVVGELVVGEPVGGPVGEPVGESVSGHSPHARGQFTWAEEEETGEEEGE
mgnify:FL=1